MRMMSDVLIQTWWGGREKAQRNEISFSINTFSTPVAGSVTELWALHRAERSLRTCRQHAESAQWQAVLWENECGCVRKSENAKRTAPFSGVFLGCDKAAWRRRSTWPPTCRFPTSLSPGRILREREKKKCFKTWFSNFFLITSHQLLMTQNLNTGWINLPNKWSMFVKKFRHDFPLRWSCNRF